MATGPPPGSLPNVPPSGEPSPPSSPISWEGDKMFNIYIYDYCNKRGFRKTARELLNEADISPESTPPINARQGLLFEWWSVFWVLFTAKSNGTGPDDAMIYTMHQAHQAQQAAVRQVGGAQRMSQHPPQPLGRFMNGTQRPPPGSVPPNGQTPNGVGPPSMPGNQGSMQNGAQVPMPFPLPGSGPQANGGHPMTSGGPPSSGAPSTQQQNFAQLLPGGQRGPQQRGPNGAAPYQSPTMAHSPQNGGGNPGHPHAQAPMGQLGPSPHLAHMGRGGMPPPNSNMGSVPSTQTPPFSQLARSPSRPGSPGQGNMMQPSPSLMHRQTPTAESNVNRDLSSLPTHTLAAIRQELGFMDRELTSLTLEEKRRIVESSRVRMGVRKPGPQGSSGPAGPSNNQQMQLPGQRAPGPPQQQQQPPNRSMKRNSTSPAEEHGTLPNNNDNSPPDRKRARRTSVGLDQAPPMSYPQQPQQGGPGGPQQMVRGLPGGGPPMANFPPHNGVNMGGNPNMMQMGAPAMQNMQNGMSPAMNHANAGAMMMQQQQQTTQEYRQSMHHMHKATLAQGFRANIGGGAIGSPASGDPSFNPSQGQAPQFPGGPNRGPGKPMGMMPPPSPALNGQPKEQQGPKQDIKLEGSPRNLPPPNPAQGQGGQGPANAGGSGQGTAPPTPSATASSMTAPSPTAHMNTTATNPATASLPEGLPNLFSNEFMATMDDFDPQQLFRQDESINFERDFGQWFSPDDIDSLGK
ncbi:hypothetical protein BV22DRAFT_1038942 [Leucogyrophana mollusca]|uniref:Uncharacterized protein n=1 Tax=Leucogyrophana mollusca TaxID=85980 RepID=A0ACB8B7N3_9AGAM|nr:hypothetical protein BV22DRAFT_1038942 [Leucogyrophana mollusca]